MKNKKQLELIGKEFRNRILSLLIGTLLLFLAISLVMQIGEEEPELCRDDIDKEYQSGCLYMGGMIIYILGIILSVFLFVTLGVCGLMGVILPFTKLGWNFEQ